MCFKEANICENAHECSRNGHNNDLIHMMTNVISMIIYVVFLASYEVIHSTSGAGRTIIMTISSTVLRILTILL